MGEILENMGYNLNCASIVSREICETAPDFISQQIQSIEEINEPCMINAVFDFIKRAFAEIIARRIPIWKTS